MASMVTLRDGSTVPQMTLITTTMSIDGLAQTNPYALLELARKCNDVTYKFNKSSSVDSATILMESYLMESTEKVHDDVVKVVKNYVKFSEDGQHLTNVNPRMQSKTVSKIELKNQKGS
jgi:hypothetical protein